MPTLSLEAGAYSVTYDNENLGVTELGFQWVIEPSYVPIRTDPTGQTIVDLLLTGPSMMLIRFEGIEWARTTMWAKAVPWLHGSSGEGTISLEAGSLLRAGAFAKPLVISKISTTGVLAKGYTYTFNYAYPTEVVNQWFSSQRLRTLPAGFLVLGNPDAQQELATFYTTS